MVDNNLTTEFVREKLLVKHYDVIALYVPVFVSALIVNILLIIVVIRNQCMRSVTNYFLVNLAVADLLVTVICIPEGVMKAYTIVHELGYYTCKISSYLQCIAVCSSIFTITTMAVDRYLAIAKPFGFFYRCFNKRTTIIVIILLWTTSVLLFFPMILIVEIEINNIRIETENVTLSFEVCIEKWNNFTWISHQNMGIIWFVSMFAVPGAIMIFAYSMMGRTLCSVMPPFDNNEGMSSMQQRNRVIRGRKRIACILLLLAFVFALCWLPYHTYLLLVDVAGIKNNAISQYMLLLGHANSALNPIIYCALSRKFRNSIKDLLYFKIQFSRKRHPNQWADSSGSGTQLNYLQRIKSVPANNQLQFTLSRLQSSQKTTKTCAV